MTWNCRNRNRTIPRPRRRKHTVGVLDGVHVSIVAFNHVDGSSHLLSEEIHVHAFLQSERGVGVPEAIRRTRNALRAFAQIRLVQEVGNQTAIKSFCGLARDVGEDSVIRLRGFGDHPDAFQIPLRHSWEPPACAIYPCPEQTTRQSRALRGLLQASCRASADSSSPLASCLYCRLSGSCCRSRSDTRRWKACPPPQFTCGLRCGACGIPPA